MIAIKEKTKKMDWTKSQIELSRINEWSPFTADMFMKGFRKLSTIDYRLDRKKI